MKNLNFKTLKTLNRIICVAILILIVTPSYSQEQDPDPLRFQSQINEFDSLDDCHKPEGNISLFVGSSSFRMWKDAEDVFSKYNAVNRGFGGSHFSDVLYFFDDIITAYSPKTILLYEGDNDIAHGKSPERVLNDFIKLVQRIESETDVENIALVSIKPSPARWNISEKMKEANKLMKDYCESKPNLTFIDIWPLMLNARDRTDKHLYIGDGLHMNQCGYKLWEKEIMKYLEEHQ